MNVLDTVKSLIGEGYSPKEIAVLYRTNAQSRALEDVFKLGSLPYQIIGGVRFYERMEIRDILAYCKLLANPSDDVSFKRIVNVPPRGLGKSTYESLSSIARSNDTPVLDVLEGRSRTFSRPRRRSGARPSSNCLREAPRYRARSPARRGWSRRSSTRPVTRSTSAQNYPDADARIENVDEVVAAAEVYTERKEDPVSRRVSRGDRARRRRGRARRCQGPGHAHDAPQREGSRVRLRDHRGSRGRARAALQLARHDRGARGREKALLRGDDARAEEALLLVREHEAADGSDRGRHSFAFSRRKSRRSASKGPSELARGGSSGDDFDELLLPVQGDARRALRGRSAPNGVRGLLAGGSRVRRGDEDHSTTISDGASSARSRAPVRTCASP